MRRWTRNLLCQRSAMMDLVVPTICLCRMVDIGKDSRISIRLSNSVHNAY
jgi:hypothetical protein